MKRSLSLIVASLIAFGGISGAQAYDKGQFQAVKSDQKESNPPVHVIDPAQKMIARNHILQIEFIKRTVLPTYRLTHHRPDPLAPSSQARNHDRPSPSKDFFNMA